MLLMEESLSLLVIWILWLLFPEEDKDDRCSDSAVYGGSRGTESLSDKDTLT